MEFLLLKWLGSYLCVTNEEKYEPHIWNIYAISQTNVMSNDQFEGRATTGFS